MSWRAFWPSVAGLPDERIDPERIVELAAREFAEIEQVVKIAAPGEDLVLSDLGESLEYKVWDLLAAFEEREKKSESVFEGKGGEDRRKRENSAEALSYEPKIVRLGVGEPLAEAVPSESNFVEVENLAEVYEERGERSKQENVGSRNFAMTADGEAAEEREAADSLSADGALSRASGRSVFGEGRAGDVRREAEDGLSARVAFGSRSGFGDEYDGKVWGEVKWRKRQGASEEYGGYNDSFGSGSERAQAERISEAEMERICERVAERLCECLDIYLQSSSIR